MRSAGKEQTMDIAAVASEATNLLLPYLPILTSVSDNFQKGVAAATTSAALDVAKRLWHRVWPALQKESAAKEATEALANQDKPKDPDDVAAIRRALKKILAEDAALASDVERLVSQNISIQKSIQQTIHGPVTDSIVIAGDTNTATKK
jgi:hypothetical protein